MKDEVHFQLCDTNQKLYTFTHTHTHLFRTFVREKRVNIKFSLRNMHELITQFLKV